MPSPQFIVEPVMLPPWFESVEAAVEAEMAVPALADVADRLNAAIGATAFAVTAMPAVPVADTV